VDQDLIVVGGGPVGTSIARAARGLSVALVAHERRVPRAAPASSFDARVYTLSPGNVAFLRRLGAMPEERATAVHAMRVYGDGGSRIDFDAYRAGVPELAWTVEDAVLNDALWSGLQAPVFAPAQCAELSLEERQARLRLTDGQVLSARLIVGADGANSFVRERSGIAMSERDYGQTALVANFACERPHGHNAFQWFQGGPVLALLPLPGNHVSMVWSLPSAEAARMQGLDAQALAREVESATGGALGQLAVVTPARSYALRRLAARRMVAPRVALAGDAAHVVHPLAGQGLNLGLQDARMLVRVLESREPVRDLGELRLLRRYERARAEPILSMDAMVDGLYRLFAAEGRAPSRLRNAGLNFTNRMTVVKNLLIRQAMN
jgi:ubiquinone biosynthesis UbiH/UbiF/VisC/COQ6 family hydroxylase